MVFVDETLNICQQMAVSLLFVDQIQLVLIPSNLVTMDYYMVQRLPMRAGHLFWGPTR
jgi:hypothetical protein